MKKIILALSLSLAVGTASFAAENLDSYSIDDQKVEQLFAQSTDVSLAAPQAMAEATTASNEMVFQSNANLHRASDKSGAVAVILDFFLGGLGIHRIYLGTATFTWIGYILTCGGIGGIVPFVDLIVLLFHMGDVSAYTDNSKFFMW